MEIPFNLLTRWPKLFLCSVFFISCKGEPCLDIERIDQLTEETLSWKLNPLINTKNVTSSIGIEDIAVLSLFEFGPTDTIYDECDNVSQSFIYETTFIFENFPLTIATELRKQGEEKGFEFKITDGEGGSAFYKFHDGSTGQNPVELLTDTTIDGISYPEILKIRFLNATQGIHIHEVYYAKQRGVVQVTLLNGIILNLP